MHFSRETSRSRTYAQHVPTALSGHFKSSKSSRQRPYVAMWVCVLLQHYTSLSVYRQGLGTHKIDETSSHNH